MTSVGLGNGAKLEIDGEGQRFGGYAIRMCLIDGQVELAAENTAREAIDIAESILTQALRALATERKIRGIE